eukprot:1140071-Pelagomonas_calceolata.AAC.4
MRKLAAIYEAELRQQHTGGQNRNPLYEEHSCHIWSGAWMQQHVFRQNSSGTTPWELPTVLVAYPSNNVRKKTK